MARNRRSQSAANRFGPAVKAFLLCLFIGGSGVGYVWQKDQIVRLGRDIKLRETRLAGLVDHNEKLRRQLAILRSPRFLETRVQELNLGLAPAAQAQIWRLTEPAAELPRPDLERQYAVQNRQGSAMP